MRTLRIVVSLVCIGLITLFCFRIVPVNATTAALAYLLAILAIAAGWGLVEAITASVAAMLCFNFFFLPPVFTFTIADAQNWVALLAFLATSIVGSQLSGRAKAQAKEALARQREMEQLYALSRAILLSGVQRDAIKRIALEIAQIFDLPAVAIYDRDSAETHRGGPEDLTGIDERLREAALQGTQFHDESAALTVTAIRLGGEPIGALAMRGASISDTALQSISYLVAIGIERIRSEEAASRADAARESAQLKSTLLDAIAHEFQTPLTSIKAAATALLLGNTGTTERVGRVADPSEAAAASCALSTSAPEEKAREELATIVDEEADRLSLLVREAIQMARLEAGQIQVNRENHMIAELVQTVLHGMQSALEGRSVDVCLPSGLPLVRVDFELLQLALRQVLDNAVKFSPLQSPLGIHAQSVDGKVILSITDHGPGIPEREQPRIFEKYYRGAAARPRATGSGLGLAIARDILKAHGGDIQVESSAGNGAKFSLLIPAATEERTGSGGDLARDQTHDAAAFRGARDAEERTGGGDLAGDQTHDAAPFRCARDKEERTGRGGDLAGDQTHDAAAFRCARNKEDEAPQ
ncbi:MAG TPA: ATP-binding protein [Bryobacteraceae bacterium]|nr:ATP-binding protein [Bryobacteraceae bacterium]